MFERKPVYLSYVSIEPVNYDGEEIWRVYGYETVFNHELAKAGLIKWTHTYGFSDREKARALCWKIMENNEKPIRTQYWEEGKIETFHAVYDIDPYVYKTTRRGTRLVNICQLYEAFAKAAGYENSYEMYTDDFDARQKWLTVWSDCWLAGYYGHEKHFFDTRQADKEGEYRDYVVVEDLS